MSRVSDMGDSSFAAEEDAMRQFFAEFEDMPIVRLSFPSKMGIRTDVALVIQDPSLWSLMVCAPDKSMHVDLHRSETLDILEGKRHPVPTDPGPGMRKDLEDYPDVAAELFMRGGIERLYERNVQRRHWFLEDEGESGQTTTTTTTEEDGAGGWRPDLRDVILLGLGTEDKEALNDMWPRGESLCLLHTMQWSRKYDEVVSRHSLDNYSFEEFQWVMWKLGHVVWDGYVLALPTRERTVPGKLPRVPDEICVVCWGEKVHNDDDQYDESVLAQGDRTEGRVGFWD